MIYQSPVPLMIPDWVSYSIAGVLFAVGAFSAYMLWRNEQVFRYRIAWLDRITAGENVPDGLASYHTMMWKFWVWPLSRFEEEAHARYRVRGSDTRAGA